MVDSTEKRFRMFNIIFTGVSIGDDLKGKHHKKIYRLYEKKTPKKHMYIELS